MEFMSAKEAADRWGISQRRVAVLCTEKRIDAAQMVGNMWIIPVDAEKPVDARKTRWEENSGDGVKPFLKWAGGKGQALREIEKYYPFEDKNFTKYAEPFVGGGAVLFDILDKFDLEEIYINDKNAELINTYKVIRDNVPDLLAHLSKYQEEFVPLETEGRKLYYARRRDRFNEIGLRKAAEKIEKAALLIFLNKTCFNGLYRVNRKGVYNVPMGAYKNPLICDEKNLRAVSEKLQNVTIDCTDYKASAKFIDSRTFVYFDPPYKPLTNTSAFTAYTENLFTDKEQVELAMFVNQMTGRGAKVLVSNSDPKNVDSENDFFEIIYSRLKIKRIEAARMINSKASARGKISELLISNF